MRDAHGAARLPAPRRRHPRPGAAQGAGAGPGAPDRLAGGQPRRPGRARHVVRRRGRPGLRRARCATGSTSSGSTRAAPARSDPVDCLSDGSSTTTSPTTPTPTPRPRSGRTRPGSRRSAAGCVERSGALAAHVSTIEAARDIDVLRAALGESTLTYLGRVVRHRARRDVRRPVPGQGRAPGPRRRGRPVDRRPGAGAGAGRGFETALRSYVQNCVDSTDSCFLGDSVEEGLARIEQFLDEVDAQPLPTGTDRDLAVGNAFYGIVCPLYSRDFWYPPQPGAQERVRRRRVHAAAALRRLHLPRGRRRLHRQQDRGDLRHQLPRRPVRRSRRRRSPASVADFERGVARPSAGSSPGAHELLRLRGPGDRAAARRAGRRRAADRGRRHHPRPGHADEVGRGAGRPARVRRPGPPRRRRPHRLQLRQRLRRRGGRGLPDRRHRPRPTASPADLSLVHA